MLFNSSSPIIVFLLLIVSFLMQRLLSFTSSSLPRGSYLVRENRFRYDIHIIYN